MVVVNIQFVRRRRCFAMRWRRSFTVSQSTPDLELGRESDDKLVSPRFLRVDLDEEGAGRTSLGGRMCSTSRSGVPALSASMIQSLQEINSRTRRASAPGTDQLEEVGRVARRARVSSWGKKFISVKRDLPLRCAPDRREVEPRRLVSGSSRIGRWGRRLFLTYRACTRDREGAGVGRGGRGRLDEATQRAYKWDVARPIIPERQPAREGHEGEMLDHHPPSRHALWEWEWKCAVREWDARSGVYSKLCTLVWSLSSQVRRRWGRSSILFLFHQ